MACLVDLEKEFDPELAITRVRGEGNNIVVEGNQQGLMSIALSMLHAASQAPSNGIQIPTMHSTGLKQVLVDQDDYFFAGAIHRLQVEHGDKARDSNRPKRLVDRIWLVGFATVALMLCLIGVGGLIFWFQLLLRNA